MATFDFLRHTDFQIAEHVEHRIQAIIRFLDEARLYTTKDDIRASLDQTRNMLADARTQAAQLLPD